MRRQSRLLLLLGVCLSAGCATSSQTRVLDAASAVELRSYQTRAFDTTDRRQTLRTVLATLQDLGFVIDKADATIGTVSATLLAGEETRITVTVRPRGETQLLVRANARRGQSAVEDPQPYQQFFNALQNAMFLAAHAVD